MRLLVFLSFLLLQIVSSHAYDRLTIGRDLQVFHAGPDVLVGGTTIELLAANRQSDFDLRAMALLLGIDPGPNSWESPSLPLTPFRSSDIRNGLAGITKSGQRIVIYDPIFFDRLHGSGSRYFVLGHEIGHHVCGHTVGAFRKNPWDYELEADRFAGSTFRNAKKLRPQFDVEEELRQAAKAFSDNPSPTHPPAHLRLAAIRDGFANGSPCSLKSMPKPK